MVLVLLLAGAGCASRGGSVPSTPGTPSTPARPSTDPPPRPREADDRDAVRVRIDADTIVDLPIERYVRGTVAAEAWVPRTDDPDVAARVFEVQALVARTYIAYNRGRHASQGFDLCATTHCQVYREMPDATFWKDVIEAAVARTRGQVIAYEGAPILALFHANCGGETSAAHAIWGGASRPYLQGAPDPYCLRGPESHWRVALDRAALTRALDADVRTRVDGRLDSIDILEVDPAGRVELVALTGARSPVIRAEELRAILVRRFGARSVRSPRFTVTRDADTFVFEGSGFGHGAGLCQAGTLQRSRDGHSAAAIIRHYYPGTEIRRWREET